jgi:hypothetical protein
VSIPGRGNTSKKPDGKPQGQVVSFTLGAADRIAKVVRKVERGDTSAEGLRFGRPVGGEGAKSFRICTFTGAWSIDAAKTVTFKNQTTTPNTVSAQNLIFDVPVACGDTAGNRDVLIAKEGTAWYYVTHERECAGQYPAADLDGDADCDASTADISQGDGPPEALLNDQGCTRWWKLHREQVVTDVTWSDGIVVKKKYVWVFRDPDEETEETIVESTVCEEEE